MRFLVKIALAVIGALLIVAAMIPIQASIIDAGGCSGKSYPCVEAQVDVTVNDANGNPLPNAHVELYYQIFSGYAGKGVQADSNGQVTFTRIPVWLENDSGMQDYYGQIRVPLGTGIIREWWYHKDIDGDVTHSTNWVSGNSYNVQIGGTTLPPDPPPFDPPIIENITQNGNVSTLTPLGPAYSPNWLMLVLGIVILVAAWRF